MSLPTHTIDSTRNTRSCCDIAVAVATAVRRFNLLHGGARTHSERSNDSHSNGNGHSHSHSDSDNHNDNYD